MVECVGYDAGRNIFEQWTLFTDYLCLFDIKADDVYNRGDLES